MSVVGWMVFSYESRFFSRLDPGSAITAYLNPNVLFAIHIAEVTPMPNYM